MNRGRLIKEAFSSVVDYYDTFMSETGHTQAQQRITQFLSQKVSGSVLDVATGTGIMLEPFFNGVGVDISQEMVRRAKEKNGKEFLVADVHCLPFKDKSFDIAISCLAFPWFEHQVEALKEMVRVAGKVYLVEEEGVAARKRINIPPTLKKFFQEIEKLEMSVDIEELALNLGFTSKKVFQEDIDGSHKFVCWEING